MDNLTGADNIRKEMEEKMRLAEQIRRQEEEQTEKNRKPRTESR